MVVTCTSPWKTVRFMPISISISSISASGGGGIGGIGGGGGGGTIGNIGATAPVGAAPIDKRRRLILRSSTSAGGGGAAMDMSEDIKLVISIASSPPATR